MRDMSLLVLEIERQGKRKRLHGLLRVGRLNTLTWEEFQELVSVTDHVKVNLADFNALHFGYRSQQNSSKLAASETGESASTKDRPTTRRRTLRKE
jgi:hypothetical protein